MRVTFSSVARKATTQITRYIIGPILDHPSVTLGHHYYNFIPLSSSHEYNREYIFSQHFLNTQLFDLATSNAICDVFIRIVSQKCQSFSTHGTPLSPKMGHTFQRKKLNSLLIPSEAQTSKHDTSSQCLTNVGYDVGPALVKHWLDMSCLLGIIISPPPLLLLPSLLMTLLIFQRYTCAAAPPFVPLLPKL